MSKGYLLTNNDGSITTTPANYAVAHDTTTQNIVVAGTFQTFTFNTNDVLNGWTHIVSTDAFTCPVTGFYLLSAFVHCNKTAGVVSLFEFQGTVNGTPVGTVFAFSLNSNNETKPISGSGLLSLTAGDIVRLEWTAGANSQVQAPVTVGLTKSVQIVISKLI